MSKQSDAAGRPGERCRPGARGHLWDDYDGSGFRPPDFGVPNYYRCLDCTTVKRVLVDPVFGRRIASTRYFYPTGYKMAADDRPTGDELRLNEARIQQQKFRRIASMAGAS